MISSTIENIVICPVCGSKLKRGSDSFTCLSKEGGDHKFSYNGNVVSFAEAHEFDKHWEPYSNVSIPLSKLKAAIAFLDPLLEFSNGGERILDVGCGDGVHAKAIADSGLSNNDISYIGLDISLTALLTAQLRVKDALLLHADTASIPLADNSIDAVFSYGVIAYTQDPFKSLKEISRVVRPGGLVGIWVYLRPEGIKGWLFETVRKITGFCGEWATNRTAELIVPLLPFLPVSSGMHLGNAGWKQCREVVLVNIAPTDLVLPEIHAVRAWIKDAGLEIFLEDFTSPVTIWARR